jgi:hypothetical protein
MSKDVKKQGNRQNRSNNWKPDGLIELHRAAKRVIIGKSDEMRRENLLKNASMDLENVTQYGKHLLYKIPQSGIEYLITDALLSDIT